jgi:uncharacterized protein (DUF2267 family)
MSLKFDKYAQEASNFMNNLALDLGCPGEKSKAAYVLRSVLHDLRDRITISESFDLMAQMPMFLKAIYVDGWKYNDKPEKIKSIEEFIEKVNEHQKTPYYEEDLYKYVIDEESIGIVLSSLRQFMSDGELEDILAQLPNELKSLFNYIRMH